MELLLVAKLCSTLCNLMNCSHARLPCPPLSPRVCSNSCPLSRWCHPTISSSVTLFFSCPKSSPASGSFLMSQLFASGSQSIGASALASVFPMDIQGWLPWGLVGFISFCPRDSQECSPAPHFESINFSALSLLVQLLHPYMTTGKTIAPTIWTFVHKVMSLILICSLDLS